jgi:CspA family cold shock protein
MYDYQKSKKYKDYKKYQKKTGVVKFFSGSYGFILSDDDSKDVFFHWSNIEMEGFKFIYEGERVLFHQVNRYRGLAATRVVKLKRRRKIKKKEEEKCLQKILQKVIQKKN